MTSLDEKAQESPDVDLARQSAPGAYRIETWELTPADDISPEGEFPEYGEFLRVVSTGGEQFIECPQGLARWIVDAGLEERDGFRIRTVQKVDGEWEYDCEQLSDDEVSKLE